MLARRINLTELKPLLNQIKDEEGEEKIDARDLFQEIYNWDKDKIIIDGIQYGEQGDYICFYLAEDKNEYDELRNIILECEFYDKNKDYREGCAHIFTLMRYTRDKLYESEEKLNNFFVDKGLPPPIVGFGLLRDIRFEYLYSGKWKIVVRNVVRTTF